MTAEQGTVLPDSIAEQLRASILAQVDAPGSAITESAVALRFGVARPTARLAIDKLVADGLLRREPHSAARVPELSRDDILDLFHARAVIECAAVASLAASGAVPADAVGAQRALVASAENFAEHDIRFHRALAAGQSSPRIARMHSMLMGEIELCIGQVQAGHLLDVTAVAQQHQGILDAITDGNHDLAISRMRDHIHTSRDSLLARINTESSSS